MTRRNFVNLLGLAAATWPLLASAQLADRSLRRIGVLMNLAADDPIGQVRLAAFLQGLQQLGWVDGRNVRIDTRWAAGDREYFRKYAAELVALRPDVILAFATPAVTALQEITRTVPIVFVGVIDPVGSGLVTSLARPRGNATGFVTFEYALAAKWLELLKEIAPGLTRAAVLRREGDDARALHINDRTTLRHQRVRTLAQNSGERPLELVGAIDGGEHVGNIGARGTAAV